MNATPPRAKIKYSRAYQPSGPGAAPAPPDADGPARGPFALPLRAAILATGLAGAALLVASEFTTLYTVHLASNGLQLHVVSTRVHDSYALIPIALLAALLTLGAALLGSRLSLLAVGALGVVTLLIALVGDLPDAQSTGVILAAGRFQSARASAGAGLYLETLGAVLLVIISGSGLLLAGPAPPRSESES